MYSNQKFKLTEKEQKFIKLFLYNNDCGASTPEELLCDNYSCQSVDDIQQFTNFSKHQISGLISSLDAKNVLMIEERDYEDGPTLYWVNDSYLETLDKHLKFDGVEVK